MCYIQTGGIKIDKHFRKNLGLYFTDGFGSDGSVVKGLRNWTTVAIVSCDTCKYKTSYTSLTEYTCTNKCQFSLQQIR